MANKKISELASASPLGVGDLFELMQGGVNKKVLASQLLSFISEHGFEIGDLTFVDGEEPSGLVNDVNVTFTIANTPEAGSVKIYWNGIRIKEVEDYTISGDTITFLVAPSTGDIILCDYRF